MRLGGTGVAVTPLGLGTGPLGNLYHAVDDERARATVDAAWDAGVRFFDTAPHYGLGLAERRLGEALRGRPRDAYTVSTKVGRVLEPTPQDARLRDDGGFEVPRTHRRVWDWSRDGVRRSLADSLDRLGLDRVDVLLLHDAERHADAAIGSGFPALRELRDAGVVRAIGAGSGDVAFLLRVVRECDPDVLLVAGRHTLLDRSAAAELLPLCAERGVAVVNGGVFNSGLLARAQPRAGLPFEYGPAPAEVVARAQGLAAVCAAHGTSLPAAALAFAARHPAVASVLVGVDSPEQMRQNAAFAAAPPPATLWPALSDLDGEKHG